MLRRAGWAGAHPARWIDGLRAVIESGRDAPSKAVADHALGMGRSGLRVGASVGWGGRALTPLIDDRLYLLYGLTSTSSRRYAAASAGCGGGRARVVELTEALELRQPTISHHVKVLHEAGVLSRTPVGREVWYGIVPNRLSAIADLLR